MSIILLEFCKIGDMLFHYSFRENRQYKKLAVIEIPCSFMNEKYQTLYFKWILINIISLDIVFEILDFCQICISCFIGCCIYFI